MNKKLKHIFNDLINEEIITFHSDAPESTIKALEFNGEWYIVKEMLLRFGYSVIEHQISN